MISFNQDFQASFSPSPNEKITGEFSQAYNLVQNFSPEVGTVDQCFANIQHSFSEKTRSSYGRAVRAFVRSAKKELEARASAVGRLALELFPESPKSDDNFAIISTLFHWQAPTEMNIAFYKSLSTEDVSNLIFLGENHFVTSLCSLHDEQKVKKRLNRVGFVDLLRRICRKKPQDNAEAKKFLDIAKSCYSLFYFPNPVDPDEDEYDISFIDYIPQFFPYLTKDERWVCLFNLPLQLRTALFYQSERLGFLEEDLQELPLSIVPTEILTRFFKTKTFPEIKSWLNDLVLEEDTEIPRLETLLVEQRRAILFQFSKHESSLLLTCLMELFQKNQ